MRTALGARGGGGLLQQECSCSGRPAAALPSLNHPRAAWNARSLAKAPIVQHTGSHRRQSGALHLARASKDDDKDGFVSVATVLGWLDEFIENFEEQMKECSETREAALSNKAAATTSVEKALWGWQADLLDRFEETDKQFLERTRTIADKVRALPPGTDLGAAVDQLGKDREIRASFLEALEGFVVVGDSLTKATGAAVFAWCTSVLLGVEPWQLWNLPPSSPLLTFAQWTAPFAALSVGLAAAGWLNERNPQRLVADPEESALGWGVVRSSGWKGTAAYALCTSYAAGVVYRGVWLNSLLGFALSSNTQRGIDPSLAEQNLRESLGTLVPSIPIPAVVVTAAVVLGVGALETASRVSSRGASVEIRVESVTEGGDTKETSFGLMPSVLGLADDLQGELPEAGRFAIAEEWFEPVNPNAVALEFVMSAYLAAETVATGSLWASIGTQALATALCVYACKVGLGNSRKGPTPPPSSGSSSSGGSATAKDAAATGARSERFGQQ